MSSWRGGSSDTDDGDFDESRIRIRPHPRGTRPRTKTRPEHSDATVGTVLAVDRGRYTVLIGENSTDERTLTATRASELRHGSLVTGDRVDLVGDTTGGEGTLARIVRVAPRRTVLRRSADDTDAIERIIVANADQLLIVVAARDPEPRVRLIDRYLVAAYDAGIHPLLAMTKIDLADPTRFLANFAGLDLTVFCSGTDTRPLADIRAHLVGHTTVCVGHSGVGKSTLVNALVPGADRATGHVNATTGRGRHTSSSTVSLRVQDASHSPSTGWIIDTPGVRSFGLGHVNPRNILGAFPDLAVVAEECPRGCTHLPSAPDCLLNESLSAGTLGAHGQGRLDSLQRLLTTFSS